MDVLVHPKMQKLIFNPNPYKPFQH